MKSSKVSYKLQILNFFEKRKRATLGQILKQKNPAFYTFRQRISELRADGYKIVCDRAKKPGDNLYTLMR